MTDQTPRLFPGKHFISSVLDSLQTKTEMTGQLRRIYLMRAGMAGVIAGVMYLTYFASVAAFTSIGPEFALVGKLVGAGIFGFALVFIYYSKSELLTSNMMLVSIGMYYRQTSIWRATKILALCFLGNLLGGLLVAGLLAGSTLIDGGVESAMSAAVELKLGYIDAGFSGLLDLFVRAIFCNFMINLAMLLVFNGRIRDDLTMSLIMISSVLVFAFVGFEHSVANSVLFLMYGLQEGLAVWSALANLGIVLVGNFLGGGLLIGIYYAYANDSERHMKSK